MKEEAKFELACVITAKQTVKEMLRQPVYKESLDEFSTAYCESLGLYGNDVPIYLDMVHYGLEIMSVAQQTFYSMVSHPQLLRTGFRNVSFELGSFNNGGQIIYWKIAENKTKIYQRKPIFWDKYATIFNGIKG